MEHVVFDTSAVVSGSGGWSASGSSGSGSVGKEDAEGSSSEIAVRHSIAEVAVLFAAGFSPVERFPSQAIRIVADCALQSAIE